MTHVLVHIIAIFVFPWQFTITDNHTFCSISCPDVGDAGGVKKALDELLTKMDICSKTQLVGASADGAAVNFGCRTGVLSQFENECPWLVTIHCTAHRLELALKDAFKNTYFTKVFDSI